MILYHGTSVAHLPAILQAGIVPRSKSGNSNWPTEFASDDAMVYLTSCYALHFALAAEHGEENVAVIEIETSGLSTRKFFPDEDFVAQGMSKVHGLLLSEAQKLALQHRNRFKHLWRDSLQKMGTVAFKGTVPLRAIKRVARVDVEKRARLLSNIDPTITPLNFMIKGEYYKQFTRWIFGDRDLLPDVEETERIEKAGIVIPGRMDAIRAESMNREGIRVEAIR